MADEGERMPIRLVKENGDVISLDATSVDIVVERIQSNFGLPLTHATKMGIDLNQAAVNIEVQGVFTEDTGQEASSKATAQIDFHQPQQLVAAAGTVIGGGGGNTGGMTSSGFNQTGLGGVAVGQTGLGGFGGGGNGFSGGLGGSLGSFPTTMDNLGNRVLKNWHKKLIQLPVSYWIENDVRLENPVSSGLQLWLKADTLSATHSPGDNVTVWTDSAASRNAVQRTSPSSSPPPTYQEGGAGNVIDGPYVEFNGLQSLEIPFNAFHNSEEFTFFSVAAYSGGSQMPIVRTYNGSTGGNNAEGYAVHIKASNQEPMVSFQQASTSNAFLGNTGYKNIRINNGSGYSSSHTGTMNVDGFSGRITQLVSVGDSLYKDIQTSTSAAGHTLLGTITNAAWSYPSTNTITVGGGLAASVSDDDTLLVKGKLTERKAHMISITMDDTNSDAQSDTVTMMLNGEPSGGNAACTIASPSSAGYTPNTAAKMLIGENGSNFLTGNIHEILLYNRVLTNDERQQVEGYLKRKYNLDLDNRHPYGHGYLYDNKHIIIAFDKDLVTSREEPYGFYNRIRSTGLSVTGSPSAGATAISLTGGNPQHWFEVSENDKPIPIKIMDANGNVQTGIGNEDGYFGKVVAVTSSSITINWTCKTPANVDLANGDRVYIDVIPYGDEDGPSLEGNASFPVYVLPIKNADTFVETAAVNKSVGPEFPNFQDGTARTADHGTHLKRTDEYIAFMLSKMLTGGVNANDENYLTTGAHSVNTAGSKLLSSVFDVEIIQGGNGHNSRLKLTQKHATSLGQLSDVINTNIGLGQMPYIEGFSGGRSGKKVKSGGDKVQDLLGILGNSANFVEIPDQNFITSMLGFGLDFVQNTVYEDVAAQGDYIRGIQIPYNSLATKGKATLDAEVAQRNFFLTTDNVPTSDKLSTVNDIHASELFSHYHHGYLKNGIGGLVTDFNVHQDAEMKAYEFSLKFAAADVML